MTDALPYQSAAQRKRQLVNLDSRETIGLGKRRVLITCLVFFPETYSFDKGIRCLKYFRVP